MIQTTAQLIRQRRRELGLTQEALAGRIHVSAKAVSKWERAAGMRPSYPPCPPRWA